MGNILGSVSQGKLPGTAIGASSTAEAQFLTNAGVQAKVLFPGPLNKIMDGRPFILRAVGIVTGGTTTNLTINLDYGLSDTPATNLTIFTSGAIAVNSVSGNWFLEAYFVWDNISKKIQGIGYGMVNNVVVAQAALVAAPATVDLSVEGLGFTVTATFSASHANNAAKLTSFEIELL